MPIESHSLVKEFPNMHDKIHQLKTTDNHFSKLFAEYDYLDHEIRKIEEGTEAASDERLEDMKRKRLALKDELYGMLKQAA